MGIFDRLFKRGNKPQSGMEKEKEEQKKMYSGELVAKVAKRLGLNEATVKCVYDTLLAEIKESLNDGETVNLTNFGKFYVAEVADRTVTAPTGKKVKIKKHNTIKFKAGAGLKSIAPKA